jgi:small-conductance mechanosensitive channel
VVNFVGADPKVRIQILIGVSYGSDVGLVRKILLEVADKDGRVLRRPEPRVRFLNFGESSLDFVLHAWIDSAFNRLAVASDLRFAIVAAFRRHKVEIPFPQRDLHLRSSEPIRVVQVPPGAAADEPAG